MAKDVAKLAYCFERDKEPPEEMKRRLVIAFLTLWLLPALACNLPTAPTVDPAVEQAVQQTLAAQLFPSTTPDAAPTLPADPVPTNLPTGEVLTTPFPSSPQSYEDGFQYTTQHGDTLESLAGRFGLPPEQILDPALYSPKALLPPGEMLTLPNAIGGVQYPGAVMPDHEIVYSPSTVGFSTHAFVEQANGFLNYYAEEVDGEILSGADIIERVALETSTNPRMLLAVLEYRSNWVFGQPADPGNTHYPIGFYANEYSGLHKEITLTARQLTLGYYGWRSGKVTELEFANRSRVRLNPILNPGSVAVQYLFSKLYNQSELQEVLYGANSFTSKYASWFGDPWQRAENLEPVLPFGLKQPPLELPFAPGEPWSFTGGPHLAWGTGSPWGGLDFAPANVEKGCGVSRFWATAAAPGIVVRAENGIVVLDLDMDGNEQTGWALMYLHIAEQDRVPLGTRVNGDDPLGHPSCEGGFSTGTHIHIARKYNGEWLPADHPVPFVLSGWHAWAGERIYSGSLIKGDQIVTARPDDAYTSIITR